MFERYCYYKWEYDYKKDKQFKKEGYDDTYMICHTCKHFTECSLKNLENTDFQTDRAMKQ